MEVGRHLGSLLGAGPRDPFRGQAPRHRPPEGAEISASAIVTTKAASAALPADSSTPVAQKKKSARPEHHRGREARTGDPPGLALPGRSSSSAGAGPERLLEATASRRSPSARRAANPACRSITPRSWSSRSDAEGQDRDPGPQRARIGFPHRRRITSADLSLGVLFLLVVVVVDATGVDLIGRLVRDDHLAELDLGVEHEPSGHR